MEGRGQREMEREDREGGRERGREAAHLTPSR